VTTPFDDASVFIHAGPSPEDPLSNGGRWVGLGTPALQAVSDYITNEPGGSFCEMLWNAASFADGTVAWVFRDNPALNHNIVIRARCLIDLSAYVLFNWNPAGPLVSISTFTGGTSATVASTTTVPSLAVGDRVGVSFLADELKVWKQTATSPPTPNPIDTGWAEIVAGTSSAVLGAGYTTLGLGALECAVGNEAYGGAPGTDGGGPVPAGTPAFNVRVRAAAP
jgi:hypothetical protein